ncbi:hypothetical protein K1W69_12605 [Hoeflea sp. WL0058]|uniref:MORN repeat protein n=1 Tax=Flavimaribacter sediminis TaxID=2865987 RepID=A0AAE2ZJM8_9HYPH|nr:hypothetical protein [Flavimaribacter sediminis]MBW8638029.1 hypothetical protein [Flavimaribacter sediminis]
MSANFEIRPGFSPIRIIGALLALIVTACASGTVYAADITLAGNQIRITGDIEVGDADAFLEILDSAKSSPPKLVRLASDGGRTYVALRIGNAIRERGLDTYAEGRCASSCGLIWLGGVERYIQDGARVGFHNSYDKNTRKAQGNALVGFYMTGLGFGHEATLFVTEADADDLKWLDKKSARETGIEFEQKTIPATFATPSIVPVPVARPTPGTVTFEDGRRYSGDLSDGVPYGLGTMIWPNGDTYHGYWKKGRRDGSGMMITVNDGIYEGTWKGDRKHGRGKERADWGSYSGEYRFGKWRGSGVLEVNGAYRYRGEFRHDRADGDGQLELADGSKYFGSFKRGLFHGDGRLIGSGKPYYSGGWKAGLRDGNGFETYPDGFSYSGSWNKGERHGPGVLAYPDRRILKATWKSGLKEGEATLITPGKPSMEIDYSGGLRHTRDFDQSAPQ